MEGPHFPEIERIAGSPERSSPSIKRVRDHNLDGTKQHLFCQIPIGSHLQPNEIKSSVQLHSEINQTTEEKNSRNKTGVLHQDLKLNKRGEQQQEHR
jgi:hypothetical protein